VPSDELGQAIQVIDLSQPGQWLEPERLFGQPLPGRQGSECRFELLVEFEHPVIERGDSEHLTFGRQFKRNRLRSRVRTGIVGS
jgi:hypothetical protein